MSDQTKKPVDEYSVMEEAEELILSLDDPRSILRVLTYLNDKIGVAAVEKSRVVISPARQPIITKDGGF